MPTEHEPAANKQAVRARSDRARERWDVLVAEVDPAWVEEPEAMGAWSFKDVVAHLAEALLGPNAFGHFHQEHEPEIRAWLAGKQAAAHRQAS